MLGPSSHTLGSQEWPGLARGCLCGPQSGEPLGFIVAEGWDHPTHTHLQEASALLTSMWTFRPEHLFSQVRMGCWREGQGKGKRHPFPVWCYCSVILVDSRKWARLPQAGPRPGNGISRHRAPVVYSSPRVRPMGTHPPKMDRRGLGETGN